MGVAVTGNKFQNQGTGSLYMGMHAARSEPHAISGEEPFVCHAILKEMKAVAGLGGLASPRLGWNDAT